MSSKSVAALIPLVWKFEGACNDEFVEDEREIKYLFFCSYFSSSLAFRLLRCLWHFVFNAALFCSFRYKSSLELGRVKGLDFCFLHIVLIESDRFMIVAA